MRGITTRRIKTREEIEDLQEQHCNGDISYVSPGFVSGMYQHCGKTYDFHVLNPTSKLYCGAGSTDPVGYTWAECWLENPMSEIELAKIEWDKQQEQK